MKEMSFKSGVKGVTCGLLAVLTLQFGKTPLDIAVDIGRPDLHQLLQQSSVRCTSHCCLADGQL